MNMVNAKRTIDNCNYRNIFIYMLYYTTITTILHNVVIAHTHTYTHIHSHTSKYI